MSECVAEEVRSDESDDFEEDERPPEPLHLRAGGAVVGYGAVEFDERRPSTRTAKKMPTSAEVWKRVAGCLPSCCRAREVESGSRSIIPTHLDDGAANARYVGNRIKTTKYTLLTFVPKNLFEQFHRFANVYFVLIVLLNWVPAVEAIAKELALIPVIFVLGVTAIKDLFEDRQRHRSDRKVNNATCRVYNAANARYVKTKWRDVRVGDIVHLACNETIPADLVLLHSSDAGVCHVETSSLDGESSLKQRQVVASLCEGGFVPVNFRSTIECEEPNCHVYKFNGWIVHPNGVRETLSKHNVLLRGCQVRNTDFVEGIVVYAGADTKAMRNNSGPRYKRSKLERMMNGHIVCCVVILLVMCFVGAVANGLWLRSFGRLTVVYLPSTFLASLNPALEAFTVFWSFVIVLQVMIPLSLYVSIEIVKIGQVFLIGNDDELLYREAQTRTQCRALNIPEELGQVEYVMCDKTGTLTENEMVFRRCTIGDEEYGPSEQEFEKSDDDESRRKERPLAERVRVNKRLSQLLLGASGSRSTNTQEASLLADFFVTLCICNTVLVAPHPHADMMSDSGVVLDEDRDAVLARGASSATISVAGTSVVASDVPESRDSKGTRVYEAESPDELALVHAAATYGFRLIKKSSAHVTVELPDASRRRYELLHVLAFDASRKRMSVIVREPPSDSGCGRLVLYCKGADSVILELLSAASTSTKRGECIVLKAHESLAQYASRGLRTMCVARRVLDVEEYGGWVEGHTRAEMTLDEMREQRIFESACAIERQMELLGVTGVEDRLQDGVAESVNSLREAGMKVWVLTGDKLETALNVAYAARLFTTATKVLHLSASTEDEADTNLQRLLDSLSPDAAQTGLLVDGRTLALCFAHAQLEAKFTRIISGCVAALCCRTTPLQKASVVKFVKEKLHGVTLAIGDGANDVSMIQCADVGVGVNGAEGMQAVMASDFAVPRFRFLKRLLLVHGHWCYSRLARMVLYFFYNNSLFVFALFWYQALCGWSAQAMIDPLYLLSFNLLFTSLPPLMLGVLDQDCEQELLIEQPALYRQGIVGMLYSSQLFCLNLLDSLWQSSVIFTIAYAAYYNSDVDLWTFGTLIMASLVICSSLQIGFQIRRWTAPIAAALAASAIGFYVFAVVYNAVATRCCAPNPPYWVAERLFTDGFYWAVQALIVVLALLPRLTVSIVSNSLYPSAVLLASVREHATRRRAKREDGKSLSRPT